MKTNCMIFIACICLFAGELYAQDTVKLHYEEDIIPNGLEQSAEYINSRGHISDVSEAELLIYRNGLSNEKTVMLVVPGGAYKEIAIEYEGYKTAEWLNTNGIAAAVLKYRLPNGNPKVSEQDIAAAMTTLKKWAKKSNVERVGIIGFSAGGHLALMSVTLLHESLRPDFAVLVYPVVSACYDNAGTFRNLLGGTPEPDISERYSLEKHVDVATPPVMLVLTADDKAVDPGNSMLLCKALIEKSIPLQMLVFPEGNHGWWMRERYKYGDVTYNEVLKWIKGPVGSCR